MEKLQGKKDGTNRARLNNTWTPLWGTATNFNIELLQRFQNKVLWVLVNAPWYALKVFIHSDLNVPTVREVITKLHVHCCGRLQAHPNHLANILLEDEEENWVLKKFKPHDLKTRSTYTTFIHCYCPVLALVCVHFKVPTSVSCFIYRQYSLEYLSPYPWSSSFPCHIQKMYLLPSFGHIVQILEK
jgi:hypothetical protein